MTAVRERGGGAASCFEALSDELVGSVLSFVPPLDLLRSTIQTCQRFRDILNGDEFWQKGIDSSARLLDNNKRLPIALTTHQLQLYSLYDSTLVVAEEEKEEEEILALLQHGSVLPSFEVAQQLKATRRFTCAASTTDRFSECIENVLQDDSRAPRISTMFRQFLLPTTWWSSQPTPAPDSRNEILLFATRYPTCVLTTVRIKPLLDPYLGHVVYSWKTTTVRAYYLQNETKKLIHGTPCSFRAPDDETPLADHRTIQHLLANETPVYEGSWPVLNPFRDAEITCSFPRGGVLANVLVVELFGKHARQTEHSGYYACVKTLECHGFPLYPSPFHTLDTVV